MSNMCRRLTPQLSRAKDDLSPLKLVEVRAGSYVVIGGLGKDSRFNGRYFVTKTTHTIGSGGYTTSFSARREDKET